jgi:hypothetical protein
MRRYLRQLALSTCCHLHAPRLVEPGHLNSRGTWGILAVPAL